MRQRRSHFIFTLKPFKLKNEIRQNEPETFCNTPEAIESKSDQGKLKVQNLSLQNLCSLPTPSAGRKRNYRP